jgi:hypothetical protein
MWGVVVDVTFLVGQKTKWRFKELSTSMLNNFSLPTALIAVMRTSRLFAAVGVTSHER